MTNHYLDTTRTKLKDHLNPLVIQFALAFEASNIHFVVTFLKETFASVYTSCVTKPKNKKSISFHFQWHQRCSILLVKDTADLTKLSLDPEDDDVKTQVKAWQQWVIFYQSRKVGHKVSKIFMLVFSLEVYNKLLKHSQSMLHVASDSTSSAATKHLDPVDVYYRFGGATLASMLHSRYKAMKLEHTKQKEKISQKIHILQALNTKDKEEVPSYLRYRDEGYMYFPCRELIPFLQDVDATVKTVYNDNGFRKHGTPLVLETTKVKQGLKISSALS